MYRDLTQPNRFTAKAACCLACLLMLTFCAKATEAYYSGGTGEPNDPFLISTPEDLNDIGNHEDHLDKHFILTNDIDLAGYTGSEFNTIGRDAGYFMGVFDGRGHTIANFTYVGAGEDVIGLFPFLMGAEAQIRNLRLTNVDISGDCGIGGLVGVVFESTIQGCYVSGRASGTIYLTGGLVGQNSGYIRDCYSNTDVTGDGQVGGLVGLNHAGVITRSGSAGAVSATDHSVGGLVGANSDGGRISNCYSNCVVTGPYIVGGLVGYNTGVATISNCYSSGLVTGESLVGGLTGYNDNSTVVTCFWDKEASEQTVMCGHEVLGGSGCDNSFGRITEQMMLENTFTGSAWDFIGEAGNGTEDIWTIDEVEDYPRFVWEAVRGFAEDEVDFGDYCLLAEYWRDEGCESSGDCGGVDVDFSGDIDFTDLRALALYWLNGY